MIDMNNTEEVAALEKLTQELKSVRTVRNTWGALVRNDDGTLREVLRKSRPCYGEIRRYADGTRPEDPHPWDLPQPIPFGTREAFGLRFYRISPDVEQNNRILEFLFGPESPWRRGLSPETSVFHKNKDGYYSVFTMTGTDIDPTVLSNLLIYQRTLSQDSSWVSDILTYEKELGLSLVEALLFRCFFRNADGCVFNFCSYFLQSKTDPKRFLSGDSVDLSRGKTWREQEDYNRPRISEIFYNPEMAPIEVTINQPGSKIDNFLKLVRDTV